MPEIERIADETDRDERRKAQHAAIEPRFAARDEEHRPANRKQCKSIQPGSWRHRERGNDESRCGDMARSACQR